MVRLLWKVLQTEEESDFSNGWDDAGTENAVMSIMILHREVRLSTRWVIILGKLVLFDTVAIKSYEGVGAAWGRPPSVTMVVSGKAGVRVKQEDLASAEDKTHRDHRSGQELRLFERQVPRSFDESQGFRL